MERQRDSATIHATGELDMAAVPILSTEVTRLRAAGCRRVIFDLSELSFIDLSGLHFLLECYAEARQDSFMIAVLPGPPHIQRLFELTGTTAELPFIPRR